MTRRKYAFYIEEEQAAALKAVKDRDGILASEQIRRALDDWFVKKGLSTKEAPKGERKRVSARRRS